MEMPTSISQSKHEQCANEAYLGELASLRSQASRLEHLVDILPAGVITLDAKGVIREANQIAIDFLGEPLKGERWVSVIERVFAPKADDGFEVSLKDGRRVKIQTTDLSPEPGQLILLNDMTETRILQTRVAKHNHLSSLGKMVATLAHQIRTPLSAAMLYGANLSNASLPHTSKTSFQQKLMSRLHDLEKQINDMLLFAKGDQQQVAQQVSLQQLLTEVEAGSDAMIIKAKSDLKTILPDPDIAIYGNKNALASAIQNLIHNSIEVIGGKAQITISAARDAHHHDTVNIDVTDNGPGIDKHQQQQIFEPFFTTRNQGTGLGLAVVRSVAEQHNGQVKVLSEMNQGATFRISLPIVELEKEHYDNTRANVNNVNNAVGQN